MKEFCLLKLIFPQISLLHFWLTVHLQFHTLRVLSTLPVTKFFPRMSIEVTKWSWILVNFLKHLALLKSQMRIDLSSLTDIRWRPAAVKTRSFTQLSWPTSVTRQRPLFASHIFIVLSLDPDARYSLESSSYYYFFSSGSVAAPPLGVTNAVSSLSSFFFSLASFLALSVLFINSMRSAALSLCGTTGVPWWLSLLSSSPPTPPFAYYLGDEKS